MRTQISVQDEGKIGFISSREQRDDKEDLVNMSVFISNVTVQALRVVMCQHSLNIYLQWFCLLSCVFKTTDSDQFPQNETENDDIMRMG